MYRHKIFSSAQHKIHFCRMGGNCLQNVLMDVWKDRDCSVQPMMIFLSSTRSKASLEPSSSSLARTRLSLNMHNLPIYVELENSLFSLCYYHWSTDNLLAYVTIGSNLPLPMKSRIGIFKTFLLIFEISKEQTVSREIVGSKNIKMRPKRDFDPVMYVLAPLCYGPKMGKILFLSLFSAYFVIS